MLSQEVNARTNNYTENFDLKAVKDISKLLLTKVFFFEEALINTNKDCIKTSGLDFSFVSHYLGGFMEVLYMKVNKKKTSSAIKNCFFY